MYAGSQQAGGLYDAVLMMIGLVMVAQLRVAKGLPTFLQKADLMQGYDLCWRDAVRYHLSQAGAAFGSSDPQETQ